VIAVWGQPSAPINPTTNRQGFPRHRDGPGANAGGQSRDRSPRMTMGRLHADHVAVLDHLRIDKCHSTASASAARSHQHAEASPERVQSAVLAQADRPRRPDGARLECQLQGLDRDARHRPEADGAGAQWLLTRTSTRQASLLRRPRLPKTIKRPCLVLAGNDERRIRGRFRKKLSKLIPRCELVTEWKTEPALTRPGQGPGVPQ